MLNPAHQPRPRPTLETKLLKQQEIDRLLKQESARHVLRRQIPEDKYDPFYNIATSLTWNNALKVPGDNIFKRIYWSAIISDAMAAEDIAQKQANELFMQNQTQAQKEAAEKDRQAKEQMHQQEINQQIQHQQANNEASSVTETSEADLDTTLSTQKILDAARQASALYYQAATLRSIHDALGIPENKDTGADFEQWFEKHQLDSDFIGVRNILLDHVADAEEFGLENITELNHFLDRVAANIVRNDKTPEDVAKADQAVLGKSVQNHFSSTLKDLKGLADQMVKDVSEDISNVFKVSPKPTPSVTPTRTDLGAEVEKYNISDAPTVDNFDVHMLKWRLATVSTMLPYPNTPQPANAQKRNLAAESKQDIGKHNEQEALERELTQFAAILNVDVRTLEKAADKTMMRTFGTQTPEMKTLQEYLDKDSPTVAKKPKERKGPLAQALQAGPKPPQ